MAIIEAKNLTKKYRLGQLESLKTTALKQFRRLTGKPVAQRALFKALDNLSFSIEEGDVVGIIGHNGAGKSTLLKVLTRITSPTSGTIEVSGRIAPLIEVGAGFVPELTGRENVYLNGSILGLSRKAIDSKFDEIVDFAEMTEFIDTPVKRYSSGMKVKLAFSVATSVHADILIVDEVLAVGDLAFQQKCIERIDELIKNANRTVVIVGHNIRQLERICSRMFLMDRGAIVLDGTPKEVCGRFYRESQERTFSRHHTDSNEIQAQQSSGLIKVDSLAILDDLGNGSEAVAMHESISLKVNLTCMQDIERVEVVVGLKTPDFVHILSVNNLSNGGGMSLVKGPNVLTCRLGPLPLRPYSYSIRLGFLDQYRQMLWYAEDITSLLVTPGGKDISKMPGLGLVDVPAVWTLSQCETFSLPPGRGG